jgi:hypothetical protein
MSDDRPSKDIKQLWSSQPTEGFVMSLEESRARSTKLQRMIRIRNLREYIAGAFVIPIFVLYIVVLPGMLTKLGSLMIILATLFVLWQLHRRGSGNAAPIGETALIHMAHYREELVRQRDALRSVGAWYLAPFVPGFSVFLIGIALQAPSLQRALPFLLVVAGLGAVSFVGVWILNRWGASRLQKQIDALSPKGESHA